MAVILVVEDDAFLREVAETTLQSWGHKTLGASDVDEAIPILESAQAIDALFTDICLKEEAHGGVDIAQRAIALRPGIRVLYATGHLLTAKVRARFVGGANCLRKPYTDEQLQQAVTSMLQPPDEDQD